VKSYCRGCGVRSRGLRLRCPYCWQPAASWLQIGMYVAIAVAVLLLLLRAL
jgi:type VI protein secretion system component VasK